MQIKRDLFRFESGARESDGTKIEPEAQAVQHIMLGSAEANIVGPGVNREGTAGSIPLQIVAHSTANQIARSVSALCANCRYFDRAGWLKMLHESDGPASSEAERHSINAIRGQILVNMPEPDQHAGPDGDYDIEHAMRSMGLCAALREFYKAKDGIDEPHGMWPTSGCPEETCTPDRPMGLFVPKDGDARKASQQNYDAVMLRAAGKVM